MTLEDLLIKYEVISLTEDGKAFWIPKSPDNIHNIIGKEFWITCAGRNIPPTKAKFCNNRGRYLQSWKDTLGTGSGDYSYQSAKHFVYDNVFIFSLTDALGKRKTIRLFSYTSGDLDIFETEEECVKAYINSLVGVMEELSGKRDKLQKKINEIEDTIYKYAISI